MGADYPNKGVNFACRSTLKQLCDELKIDRRDARERLRVNAKDAKKYPELSKMHKPRTPWQWAKGSAGEKEARAALKS